jgi:hypothetical protein
LKETDKVNINKQLHTIFSYEGFVDFNLDTSKKLEKKEEEIKALEKENKERIDEIYKLKI